MPVLKTIILIVKSSVFILLGWGKAWHSMPLLNSVGCVERAREYYHDHFANGACTRAGLNSALPKPAA